MEVEVVGVDVIEGDKEERSHSFPVVVVLDRLRSAFNVGNIFRLCDTTSAQSVFLCGYTATPPHPKLKRTARGCDERVPFKHFETSKDAVLFLKKEGYHVVGVETVKSAPYVWDKELTLPIAYVFGNEALGIHEDTLPLCDSFIQLPVMGFKNSLNVSNCAAVVLYDTLRKMMTKNEAKDIG